MCKLKSGIILKDRIFIPDYDSHNKMLEELGIEDTRKNAKRLFIRAELFPVNDDVFTPISEWQYKVDQDITPDWYVPDYDEKRMRDAVAEWAEEHILIGVKGKTLNSLQNIYLKDCVDITCGNSTVKAYSNSTVRAYDNSTVTACDNSTVKAYSNSTVRAYDNSTVTAYDNSTVRAYDNSTVTAYNKSTVTAYSNSTVTACDNSTVKAYSNSTVKAYSNSTVRAYDNSTVVIPNWSPNKRENIVLTHNSTLKDCKSKTIYQSGDWKLVEVHENVQ